MAIAAERLRPDRLDQLAGHTGLSSKLPARPGRLGFAGFAG
jgi:hypothetical protein